MVDSKGIWVMKKQLAYVVATGLAAVVWSAGAAANLVNNGSFETLVGGQDLSGTYYEAVSPGLVSVRIDGWAVSSVSPGNSVDIVRDGTGASNPNALDWAYAGEYAIDMAGSPGPASISQDIGAAVASQAYLLSFWTSSNGSALTGALDVLWNGVSVLGSALVSPAQGDWAQHQFTVYGTAGLDTLKFTDLKGGNAGVLLDNVSLTAVPLPPAAILFGSVLFGFATMARKRRASEGALTA